jgi:hypothetical protein
MISIGKKNEKLLAALLKSVFYSIDGKNVFY